MEHSVVRNLVAYMQAHPLLAAALLVLVAMVLGSLLRRLLKAAVVLGLVLLAVLYWTHRQAEVNWQQEMLEWRRRATELGQSTLEEGRSLLRQGEDKLRQRMDGGDDQ